VSKVLREQNGPHQPDGEWLPGFSLDSLEDKLRSRRGFLTFLMAGSAALFLATVPFARRFLWPNEKQFPKLELLRVTDMPPGGALPFSYPGKDDPALLVHLANGEWRAYGGMCTHLGCVVYWDTASERLVCPCHNAAFESEAGAVLMGPPRRPLPRIDLNIEGERIYAVGMKL